MTKMWCHLQDWCQVDVQTFSFSASQQQSDNKKTIIEQLNLVKPPQVQPQLQCIWCVIDTKKAWGIPITLSSIVHAGQIMYNQMFDSQEDMCLE